MRFEALTDSREGLETKKLFPYREHIFRQTYREWRRISKDEEGLKAKYSFTRPHSTPLSSDKVGFCTELFLGD